jgi:protoheme ferro-lyase
LFEKFIKLLKDPSKHNYKKISGLSDSVVVELMHTSNLQISLIKGQLSQLNSQLDVTVEAIEAHFQSVIDEIIEELNLQKEKTLRGADNRRNSRKK